MRTLDVLRGALDGEITTSHAAEILRVPIEAVEEWLRLRREGWPSLDERCLERHRKKMSDRLRDVVTLYAEHYRGLPVPAFHRALRDDHGIVASEDGVREALRASRLIPRARLAGLRRKARELLTPKTETPPTSVSAQLGEALEEAQATVERLETQIRAELEADARDTRTARAFQDVSGRLQRLNDSARSTLAEWRRGRVTMAEVTAAFAAVDACARELGELVASADQKR